jgi:hypothetical protein
MKSLRMDGGWQMIAISHLTQIRASSEWLLGEHQVRNFLATYHGENKLNFDEMVMTSALY